MTLDAAQPRDPRPALAAAAVVVRDLHKRYGDVVAVDGLSLEVPTSCVFGLIGPNGAGKTTTIECVEGVKTPDAGHLEVLGRDPAKEGQRLFERIGVQLQEESLYGRVRVEEAFKLFASFYPHPLAGEDLLERFELADRRRTFFLSLSGGEKRRVSIALALIGRPELVLLDEPTSGLDPHARRRVWEVIGEFRAQGATILLNTHLLQEAEEHCDLVAVVDHGRVVASGGPRELLRGHGLRTRVTAPLHESAARDALARLPSVVKLDVRDGKVHAFGQAGDLVSEATRILAGHGVEAGDIEVRPANLEDLYMLMTGREYQGE